MRTTLTYTHTRNIFTKNRFKPFVYKYFENPKFEGCDGGWEAKLSVSNWEQVKNDLPKYAIPEKVEIKEINFQRPLHTEN